MIYESAPVKFFLGFGTLQVQVDGALERNLAERL